MKKINFFILAAMAMVAPVFTACSNSNDEENKTINNMVSEYSVNDEMVAKQKKQSGKDVAVLLVAFGSTWNNAFQAFDATKKAYEAEFPEADVYVSFSSDICINRASAGENYDDEGNLAKRDFYEPRYLLHAIGKAQYSKIYVQSLQVIPGEEFAAVVASVKKFMNNGYIAEAHLSDDYLKKLETDKAIFLGLPLLSNPDPDGAADAEVKTVAKELDKLYKSETNQGVVAFMGHGNPDSYDTFKANERYTQLQNELQAFSSNYFVGTVDAPGTYKQDVLNDIQNSSITPGKIYLHALMSIAGDHAHNDMAGQGEEYWDPNDPESEDNSWYEYFSHNGFTPVVPVVGKHPQGLLELESIRNIWIQHTKNAQFLEDAYHSMYPEE